jgi:hypothetical protein
MKAEMGRHVVRTCAYAYMISVGRPDGKILLERLDVNRRIILLK